MTVPLGHDLASIRDDLARVVARLDGLLVDEDAPGRAASADVRGLPRTRAIEYVLQLEGRPMRPIEIWAALRSLGRHDPKMEVQVTTYDLWQRGRLGKLGRGLYQAMATPKATDG